MCIRDSPLTRAWRAPSVITSLDDALGGISADLLCPYPPGIPMLVPGERVDRRRLAWLQRQRGFWGEQLPNHVRLVANSG